MNLRFPLYGKILAWFFLNLVLLVVTAYLLVQGQFHFGLDSLLAGRAGARVQAVADLIVAELRDSPREQWSEVLNRFTEAYQLEFYLFRTDGQQVVAKPVTVPVELREKLFDRRGGPGPKFNASEPSPGQPRFQPGANVGDAGPRPDGFRRDGFRADLPRPEGMRPTVPGREFIEGVAPPAGAAGFPLNGPQPKFMVRSRNPDRYWVGMRLPMGDRQSRAPQPLALILASDSLRGGGLFFDFTPWIVLGAGAVVGSVLLWFPLVRGITRSVSRMTAATERIAEGEFEARVVLNRSDELGSLAGAINQMAARLAGFVGGQKRFLGDIAHELCAPLARIQMAIGILEQRADAETRPYVADLREEVQAMSGLVNELLSFSKAGLRQKEIELRELELAPVVMRVAAREDASGGSVKVEIPPGLKVWGEAELLSRAVGNLIRNSMRHAGGAGPIVVAARADGERVRLSVADSGPGVPEQLLQQIFDPFFRVDESRTRDTGGVGLGLAIVKTCVTACQGVVTARNRPPHGLIVEIELKRA